MITHPYLHQLIDVFTNAFVEKELILAQDLEFIKEKGSFETEINNSLLTMTNMISLVNKEFKLLTLEKIKHEYEQETTLVYYNIKINWYSNTLDFYIGFAIKEQNNKLYIINAEVLFPDDINQSLPPFNPVPYQLERKIRIKQKPYGGLPSVYEPTTKIINKYQHLIKR